MHVDAVEFVAITNDVLPDVDRHYVTIWMKGSAGESAVVIHDQAEIAAAGWYAPDALPEPRHLYFQNLLAGRCMPSKPANSPFQSRRVQVTPARMHVHDAD